MKFHKLLIPVLLSCLATAGLADVFVKNKPFKGNAAGTGAGTLVEAEPMLKSLGITGYRLEGNTLILGEKSLPLEGGMVGLKELSDAVGARMVVNASMGTVDVFPNAEALSKDSGKSWGSGVWHTSWEDAVVEARQNNKPILVDFTGSDWCGWCKKLKREVFDTDQFKMWAASNVVLLEIDFPHNRKLAPSVEAANQKLAQKYGVKGFPTIMFVDAGGKALGKMGYEEGGPAVWTGKADPIVRRSK